MNKKQVLAIVQMIICAGLVVAGITRMIAQYNQSLWFSFYFYMAVTGFCAFLGFLGASKYKDEDFVKTIKETTDDKKEA